MRDARELIALLTGYQPAAVVAAGCRTGVFDALEDRPSTLAGLAVRTGLAPVPLGAVLDVLVAVGLVTGVDGPDGRRYGGTPLAGRLRTGGDLAAVVGKEAFFARVWTDLDETLRTARPCVPPWKERLATDPESARGFLVALATLARETGPDLTLLPELGPGRRVLDVGGGLGSSAVPLAVNGADVTLVDLPPVAAWAREALEAEPTLRGALGTVTVREADVLSDPACGVPPASVDTVLVSHLLHDLGDRDARRLLGEARAAVRPGGRVVVVELPGDGDGSFGPLFDLMMQIETPGRARSGPAIQALLAGSGLVDVRVAAYPRPVLVTSGRRP